MHATAASKWYRATFLARKSRDAAAIVHTMTVGCVSKLAFRRCASHKFLRDTAALRIMHDAEIMRVQQNVGSAQ